MKRIFITAGLLIFMVGEPMAQPGVIGVYGDPAGAVCDFVDYLGVDALIYVIHTYSPGATGARFKLHWAAGANMTYLGERVTDPYFGKGTAFSGISIEFGSCVSSPNMMLTLHFKGNGDSPTCSFLVVLPHPGDESAYVNDCSDPPNLLAAGNDCLVINNDGTCPCNLPGWSPCPDIVPVHDSTWGHIKMLYLSPD
jgi:hypothetical protein